MTIFVVLTGGLGNQIFQLYAGLALSKSKPLILIEGLGTPKMRHLNAEIFDFELPENVHKFHKNQFSQLSKKAFSYLISRNTRTSFIYQNFIIKSLLSTACRFVLILSIRRFVMICLANDLGFSNFKLSKYPTLIVGYFQSFYWYEQLKLIKSNINLQLSTLNFSYHDLIEEAKIIRPTIIHIRLGDYKYEHQIQVVSKNYYLKAVNELCKNLNVEVYWLFSDEPEIAINFIPANILHKTRIIHNPKASSSETLDLMKYGTNYVLSNSTFGWWAAMFSVNAPNFIFVPKPWFALIESPKYLIPSTWKEVLRD